MFAVILLRKAGIVKTVGHITGEIVECEAHDCSAEAVAIAHWPGQETRQCELHCRGLNKISQVMGAGALAFTDLETGLTMKFTGVKD